MRTHRILFACFTGRFGRRTVFVGSAHLEEIQTLSLVAYTAIEFSVCGLWALKTTRYASSSCKPALNRSIGPSKEPISQDILISELALRLVESARIGGALVLWEIDLTYKMLLPFVKLLINEVVLKSTNMTLGWLRISCLRPKLKQSHENLLEIAQHKALVKTTSPERQECK